MHGRPKSTAAPFASTVVQRTRADGQLAERDVGIPHAGVPTRGLESRAFFVTVLSFYSTLVSILVVAAVVIGDAGRHRAAGRVVIGEVDRPLSSYFFLQFWLRFQIGIATLFPGRLCFAVVRARQKKSSQMDNL